MQIYAILNFIDCAISILLAALVFWKGKDRRLGLPFFYWIASVGVWSFGVGMHSLRDLKLDLEGALFWSRFLHVGAVLIPVFFMHFVMILCQSLNRTILRVIYLASVFFIFLIPTKIFISEVSAVYIFSYFPKIGIAYPFFIIIFCFCVMYSVYLLFAEYRNQQGIRKNQILYILLGSSIGYSLGSTAFLPMFGIPIFPFGTPFVILNGMLIAYAIIRYRIMDMNLIMRWSLAYGTSIAIIVSIFLTIVLITEKVLVSYLKFGKGVATVVAACLAALVFDPIRRFISNLVDKFIFKSPDFQILIQGLEKKIIRSASIEELTEGLSDQLLEIWKVNHAGFSIWDSKESIFRLYPEKNFENHILNRMKEQIMPDDFLIRTLESERRLFKYGIVVEEELTALGNRASAGERTTFWKIRRTMRWVGASVCVPLMSGENILGFIILGPKIDNALYNDEDKKFLSHVAEKVSEAIQRLMLRPYEAADSELNSQPAV